MAQPPHNNMPLTEHEDTEDSSSEDNKPLSTTVKSSTKKETSRQQIARLKREQKSDRKKLVFAETTVRAQGTSYESYKNSMEATVEALKRNVSDCNGQIDSLSFKEKMATDAAITASKLVDNTSAQVIDSNCSIIRGLRKANNAQAVKLLAANTVAQNYQRLKEEQETWGAEKKLLLKLNTALNKTKATQDAIVAEQTQLKAKHRLEIANVALETKRVSLQQTLLKQQNAEKSSNNNMANKMKYTEFHFQQRDAHKEKDLERKETVKDRQKQNVRDRIQSTSSDMTRLNMLNGGAFPPASSMRLVSVHQQSVSVSISIVPTLRCTIFLFSMFFHILIKKPTSNNIIPSSPTGRP